MNNSSSSLTKRQPRRQPKQKRGKERVEKILIAAAEAFLEVGYSAATTQQIADQAETAIGSIYQFFPDKLAIFHALEEIHHEKITRMARLLLDADVRQPLSELMDEVLTGHADFFANPISRCVVFQLLQPHVPGLFAIFDLNTERSLEQQSIGRLADFFQQRNPKLSRDRSELLSEVAHHIYRSLFFAAIKSSRPEHREALFAEIKDVLYAYLEPHIGDQFIDLSG